MENLFASRLFARAFTTTALAIALLFSAMFLAIVPFIESAISAAEERTAHTALDNVFEMVEQIERDLESQRQSILLGRKNELRSIVAVAESRARRLDADVTAGKLPRQAAKRQLLAELRDVRYGHNDYVWASDYRSVLVSHPDPKLDNADFSKVVDTRNNFIVPPMVQGAQLQGEGYHSYWWRRLGEEQPVEKLSYYKHLPMFELVIGTGVYVDDVELVLQSRRAAALENLRNRLKSMRIAKTGYMYIFDGNLRMMIHPNPNIENTDFSKLLEPETGRPLGPILMAAADRPAGVRYKWDHPSDPGHYAYDKISWVRHFEAADWYIASSVYVAELKESADILKQRLLMAFLVTLLISIVLIYFFVKRLVRPLRQLSDTAQQVRDGDLSARCGLRRDDEIGVVAQAFDVMVDRLQDNIEHLDAHVKRRTAELERANAELMKLDQLKSDFLSTVSHELRTPMTSVVGFVKRVGKKLEEAVFPKVAADDEKAGRAMAQVRGNLDIIVKESERLTLLINDVLDSAKLDAGKVEWRFEPLAPARLLAQAAAVSAALAEQKGLVLTWHVEPGTPDVRGDATRMQQVLINLLSNAIKFTPHGEIVATAARHGATAVAFSVRDTGIGIAPEYLDQVFDKFKQIGDTLTDKPQGTGLGLSICRQIVEGHGGRIWVEAASGGGSIFRFLLPAVSAEPRDETGGTDAETGA